MGSGAVTGIALPKVTPWVSAPEIVPYLEEGDLIEFQRDVFQHWAVYIHSEGDNHFVVHLTGNNDNDFLSLSADAASSPLRASFQATTQSVRSGFRSRSFSGTNIQSYVRTSLKEAETAEVCSHLLFTVAGNSRCRVNNSKDADFVHFSAEQICARAISEIGRQKYNLLFTNCEHFATWCRYGSKSSTQTTKIKSLAVGTVAAAVTGSVGLGFTAGAVCLVACHACNKAWNKISRSFELMW